MGISLFTIFSSSSFVAEGMQEFDFVEAHDDIRSLIREYQKEEEDTSDRSFSSNTDGM